MSAFVPDFYKAKYAVVKSRAQGKYLNSYGPKVG